MNKYAIIINFCAIHLPGFNALINGLDIYENNIDVFAIYESEGQSAIPEDYLEKLKKHHFKFKIELIKFEDILRKYDYNLDNSFANAVYAPYYIMLEIKNTYDAVSYWGGDQIILDNIDNYYQIGANTDLILTGNNPYTLDDPGDWDGISNNHYFWDMPMIINPKIHERLIHQLLKYKEKDHSNMGAMNQAIKDLKLLKKVIRLPDIVWTVGIPYLYKLEKYYDLKGRLRLFAARERVVSFHKKWWLSTICNQYLYDKKHLQYCSDNINLMRDIYKELNVKGKIKYEY